MNKSQMIERIADSTSMSKADSNRALEAIIKIIKDSLKSGEQVTIVGFGTFLARDRKARAGRNPRTGETIQISASKVPAFKPGKALKDEVNS
ncbi:MAG: HU family DNA-binding protein [Candidatus Oxydemutatoraceae bacterium WSBS_2016_MAG_OTU14]